MDIFGRRRADRPSRVTDRLMGCWQMTELFLVGSSSAGRKAQGALLVSDGFISFELHAAWSLNSSALGQAVAQDVPESDVHVSFTGEYTLDGSGLLATSTILGSYIDEETGTLQWERPGYRREYQVTQRLGELILTWGNKGEPVNRMVFRRRIPTEGGDRDIFGAKRGAKGLGEGLDIFGQPKKAGSGLRDVFGREEGDGSEENEEEEGTKGGDEGANDGQ